jgi:muramidase (phage lysozyme)
MRRTAGSRQENAFIQTIRTVEGTSGPDGYNTVYGGAVVPQLTQMTLGELYDAIKLGGTDAIPARLGGGKIPFKKDKYNSSASGALQLMPETLRGLVENSGYSWDDVFSPETQDRMMLDLARQGGVDIENMSPAQMEKAGNIWAGASPRYGQTTRTASDSYRIYQSLLQQ